MSEEVKPTEEVQVEVRADGPAVAKMRANGILKTEKDELGYLKNDDYGLVSGFGERMDAMKEIKATDFAPGTLGHITKYPMQYGFMERTKAMQMIQKQPLDTMTEFKPSKGCCSVM